MKLRTLIISVIVLCFMFFSAAPRAKADPLTIMAVVGVTTVILAATADETIHDHEDDRDMRAEQKSDMENTRETVSTDAPAGSFSMVAGDVAP